jgi:hypothetical protein
MPPLEFAQSFSDVQLAKLLQVATFLLVPLALLFLVLIYKLVMLLQHAVDFVQVARFDVLPLLQDARHITHHVSHLTQQVNDGVASVQRTVDKAAPLMNKARQGTRKAGTGIMEGFFYVADAVMRARHKMKGHTSSATSTSAAAVPVTRPVATPAPLNPHDPTL